MKPATRRILIGLTAFLAGGALAIVGFAAWLASVAGGIHG